MAEKSPPLLIKRYASRRLYNTETSDYVTLEDVAGFIRAGRDVQVVDLKTGDDLTRQFLLQIIAEHESRGQAVLPLSVLVDLVRSYTPQAQSVVPDFLAASFEVLRSGQSQVMENMSSMNPLARMPGFEAMQNQQKAWFETITSGIPGWPSAHAASDHKTETDTAGEKGTDTELDDIRQRLDEMQAQLSKLHKPG